MRISWVDNLRGIGILLIVLGHSFLPEDSVLTKYIFSFHVVLFFILSGFLFNEKKHTNINKFIKNKFFRLIIPFFFFNIIFFLFFKLLGKYEGTRIIDFLVGVFYGDYLGDNGGYMNNTGGFNITNISTWFLTTLFITSIYYFIINKFIKNRLFKILVLFLLSLLVYIESTFTIFRFPWGMEISFMMLFFYALANSYKREIIKIVEKINIKYLLLIPIILIFHFTLLNSTNISTNYYGNYILLILNSFLGFFTVLIISKVTGKNKILNFFGKNSIIILGFEWIKELIILNINFISLGLLSYERTYITGFTQFFITMIFLIPIIIIINKYLPFILGQGYSNKKTLKEQISK